MGLLNPKVGATQKWVVTGLRQEINLVIFYYSYEYVVNSMFKSGSRIFPWRGQSGSQDSPERSQSGSRFRKRCWVPLPGLQQCLGLNGREVFFGVGGLLEVEEKLRFFMAK